MPAAATPQMGWSSQDAGDEPVVWWTRLDSRYQIEVIRINAGEGRTAHLRIFDHNNGDALLLEEEVGLAYGAIFGPDVSDVFEWQERALRFVDTEMAGK